MFENIMKIIVECEFFTFFINDIGLNCVSFFNDENLLIVVYCETINQVRLMS